MTAEMEMRIANRRDEMPAVAAMVEQFGAAHLVPIHIVNALNVALDEVVNNIISYGFEPDTRSEVLVRLSLDGREIAIEVEDAGRAFDPVAAPPPDMAGSRRERRVGGLGIHFVKELMDDVTYARTAGRNRLRLIKRLGPT